MKHLAIAIALTIFLGCTTVPPQVNDTMLAVQRDGNFYRQVDGGATFNTSIRAADDFTVPMPQLATLRGASCIDRAAWYVQLYLSWCDELGYPRPDFIGYRDNFETNHRTVLVRYGHEITEIDPVNGLSIDERWWMN